MARWGNVRLSQSCTRGHQLPDDGDCIRLDANKTIAKGFWARGKFANADTLIVVMKNILESGHIPGRAHCRWDDFRAACLLKSSPCCPEGLLDLHRLVRNLETYEA